MSATKAARAAKAAADRRRVWYVMTSRVGREPRAKRERGTEPARSERAAGVSGTYDAKNDNGGGPGRCAAPTGKEESNAEV